MRMTSWITFAICLLLSFQTAFAQRLTGTWQSNFSGTYGLYANPANAADARDLVYLNLFGGGINVGNNYLQYPGQTTALRNMDWSATNPYYLGLASLQLNEGELIEKLNGRDKMLHLGAALYGPAVLVSWDRANSIGISTRVRSAFQVNGLNEELARAMRYRFADENAGFDRPLTPDDDLNISAHTFAETAITYGRVAVDNNEHFLKTGVTIKRLRGLQASFLSSRRFDYHIPGPDSLVVREATLEHGYVDNTAGLSTSPTELLGGPSFGAGWGFDLGFVYEYRPDYLDYRYRMDGQERIADRKNKYRFKFGAALLDAGSIRYEAPDRVRSYTLRGEDVAFDALSALPLKDPEALRETAEESFDVTDETTAFVMGLPTALNWQLDVMIEKRFYLNVTYLQNLRGLEHRGTRANSFMTVAPRAEFRWFEVGVPLMLTEDFFNFNFGSFVRLGPVFVGSDNIGGLVGATRASGADVYFGASIPVGKIRKRDRDGDGVSDRKDACPERGGSWETGGCPDSDGDGIIDEKDGCPNLAGPAKLNGCPDSDGDGVIDPKDRCKDVAGLRSAFGCPDDDGDQTPNHEDECPELAGTSATKGCPDGDGDGVADKDDRCPNQAGEARFEGCPDSDGDNVPDPDDKCPTVAAKGKESGCPDSDGDGLDDYEDECPTKRGLAKFSGCPDSDFDGAIDSQDECPYVYGSPENNGCPLVQVDEPAEELVELTVEEAEVLREAFENLEFEFGKATIRDESKGELIDLANLMRKKTEARLRIDGHTDNVGSDEINEKLSRERAEAVKRYLVSRGVSATRVLTRGFGAQRPVSSNDTEEGRQRNRRVEFRIIK